MFEKLTSTRLPTADAPTSDLHLATERIHLIGAQAHLGILIDDIMDGVEKSDATRLCHTLGAIGSAGINDRQSENTATWGADYIEFCTRRFLRLEHLLHRTAEKLEDTTAVAAIAVFYRQGSHDPMAVEAKFRLEFGEMVLRYARRHHFGDAIPDLPASTIIKTAQGIWRLGLVEGGLSRAGVDRFIGALTRVWYLHGHQLTVEGLADLAPDLSCGTFHLGFYKSADATLHGLANNYEGHSRLFGNHASGILSRRIGIPFPSPNSEVLVSLERGVKEGSTGISIACYSSLNRASESPIARVDSTFMDERTLGVVTMQGKGLGHFERELSRISNGVKIPGAELSQLMRAALSEPALAPELFAREKIRIRSYFGSTGELDTLLLAKIAFAQSAGFSRICGVREEDQRACMAARRMKRAGSSVYCARFARFGFAPPTGPLELWSLNLEDLSLWDGEKQGAPMSIECYASTVLARRNPGDRINYPEWSKPRQLERDALETILRTVIRPAQELGRRFAL